MNTQQSLFSLVNISIAVVAAYFLFREKSRDTLLSRGPLFIICFLPFLSVGIGNLPLALPGVFERVLGHSVWASYMPPVKLNVTQVAGTWWLVRWREPIQTGYFVAFLAGMAWAAVNIARRRARKLNVLPASVGVAWMLGSLIYSFACFPFCY